MATTAPQAAGAMPQPTALDPVQKRAFDLMIKQAMSVLAQDGAARHIVAKAKATSPQEAVLEAIVPLLNTIYQSSQGAGAKVEMVTVLAAGIQIVAVLAKMLEIAGLLTEEQIPAFCAEVAKQAVDQHNAKLQSGGMAGPAGAAAPAAPQPQGA